MDESSSWQSKPGHLEKLEKDALGQEIKSSYNPRLGIVRISEGFSDTSRRYYYVPKGEVLFKSLLGRHEARFLDKEGKSLTEAQILSNGDLNVDCFDHKYSVDISGLGVWGAGLHLTYGPDGKIKSCVLRAESISQQRDEEPRPWEEKIEELINLIKSADESNLAAMQGWISASRNNIEIKMPEEEIETKSQAVKEYVRKQMEKGFTSEDIALLEKSGFFEGLAYSALNNPNISLNEHLDEVVDDFIRELIEASSKEYSRLLELGEIRDQDFEWREIDSEWSMNKGEEKKILKEGVKTYGEEIPVEGNRFVINRDGNELTVYCKTQKGNISWIGRFPIVIPFGEIVRILKDPSEDFRKIKDMLGVSLSFS